MDVVRETEVLDPMLQETATHAVADDRGLDVDAGALERQASLDQKTEAATRSDRADRQNLRPRFRPRQLRRRALVDLGIHADVNDMDFFFGNGWIQTTQECFVECRDRSDRRRTRDLFEQQQTMHEDIRTVN